MRHGASRGDCEVTPQPTANASSPPPRSPSGATARECRWRRSPTRRGVGIGTLYRHYPTRPALLAALTLRSFHLVLQHARAAAQSDEPAPAALTQFFEQTIAARNEFILPLHGGPVIDDEKIVALQTEIRNLLEQVLARGRRDRTIRPDATPDRHHHHRSDARPTTPTRSRLGPTRPPASQNLRRRPRCHRPTTPRLATHPRPTPSRIRARRRPALMTGRA